MKNSLVTNATISHLAYRLSKVGKPYHTQSGTKRLIGKGQKAVADSFEVYLGALYHDAQARGEPCLVRDWLEKLWSATVFPDFDQQVKKISQVIVADRKDDHSIPISSKVSQSVMTDTAEASRVKQTLVTKAATASSESQAEVKTAVPAVKAKIKKVVPQGVVLKKGKTDNSAPASLPKLKPVKSDTVRQLTPVMSKKQEQKKKKKKKVLVA